MGLPTEHQGLYTHRVSSSSARRGHSGTISPELALLGFLFAGPSHGYDLHQRFISELGSVWHMSQSQAYSILRRLEARGDIASRMIEQEKAPARQELRITAAGRRRFLDWLEKGCGTNARSIRLEFLTRLYFAKLYWPEKADGIFSMQMDEIGNDIARLERALDALPPDQTYNRLSLDLRVRQMQLIQQWVREIGRLFRISSGGGQ
jgi:PadR family transcriptional regulator AphA